MWSKLSYQLKIICYIKIFYVSLIVTTKQTPAGDTQKIKRKESKHQFPRKDRRGRKGQRNYKIARKQLTKCNKDIPINNFFKCKLLNSPIKRNRVDKWVKKNKDPCYAACKRLTSDVRTYRLKVKTWKKICHENENQMKPSVVYS